MNSMKIETTKPPRLHAPCEIAALWSCSTKQVLQLCREGRLPHVRINPRVIRISAVDAAIFVATEMRGGKSN